MGANGRTLGRIPLPAAVVMAPGCWLNKFFRHARAAAAFARDDVHDLTLASDSPPQHDLTGGRRSLSAIGDSRWLASSVGTATGAPRKFLRSPAAARRHAFLHDALASVAHGTLSASRETSPEATWRGRKCSSRGETLMTRYCNFMTTPMATRLNSMMNRHIIHVLARSRGTCQRLSRRCSASGAPRVRLIRPRGAGLRMITYGAHARTE